MANTSEGTSWTLFCQPINERGVLLGGAIAVEVVPSMHVTTLRQRIYEQLPSSTRRRFSANQLSLWQPVKNLSGLLSPLELQRSITDFKFPDPRSGDQSTNDVKLVNAARKISAYWPTSADKEFIHLIAVPQPVVDDEPTPPVGQPAFFYPRTGPRESDEETRFQVETYLSQYDDQLREYLEGPPWNVFWEAPSSVDPETKRYIDNLTIPQVEGEPMLLLHDLGNGIVDQKLLDELFDNKSRILANASGSGKTRLLLEGLIKHWGFYFTASPNPLGSTDILHIIQHHIPNTDGFIEDPEKLDISKDCAFSDNEYIASRRIRQVIVARILIFKRFLSISRDSRSTLPIQDLRKHWLFLQLRPTDILGKDVFKELTELLMDANDKYLMDGSGKIGDKLRQLRNDFNLNEDVIGVVDDAQVAAQLLSKSFRSEEYQSEGRPFLKPFVRTWSTCVHLPIIVAGTSLSLDFLNEIRGGGAAQFRQFLLSTETGSFDDRKRQYQYISRYLPRRFLESKSGEDFLEKIWTWARGR